MLVRESAAWWWTVLDLVCDDGLLGLLGWLVAWDGKVIVCEHLVFMKRRRQKRLGNCRGYLLGRVFESLDTSAGNEVLKTLIGVSDEAGVDVLVAAGLIWAGRSQINKACSVRSVRRIARGNTIRRVRRRGELEP